MFEFFDDGDENFLFGSSSESENDEDFFDEDFCTRTRDENYLDHTVHLYTEEEFKEHFRMSRELIQNLSDQYEKSTHFHTGIGLFGNISPLNQVLIFVWYAGHQTSSFRDVADRFDITISTLHRITRRVALFLSSLSPQIIKWPSDQEKVVSELHFRRNGFPGVIGAIDGTHIKIPRPSTDPKLYFNGKGYFSIQMQAVCDHKRKFIDIFLGYPGSVNDSQVFRNSPLYETLDEKCGGYYILGDSGYPLQTHLLTPYKDRGQMTGVQANYNVRLSQNRYVIEHAFGILKQKFRQLHHVKLRDINFIAHFIRACCVLHNICLDDDFQLNLDLEIDNPPEVQDGPEENLIAIRIRDSIANTLYRL